MKQRKSLVPKPFPVTVYILAVMTVVLIIVNTTYYVTTRKALISVQEQNMRAITDQIRSSIKLSQSGEAFVEDLIGENLRMAAQAAQSKIGSDMNEVTNQQLAEVSKEVGVDRITLLAPSGNNIVPIRSSDPNELSVKEEWRADWLKAVQELLARKTPTVDIGQKLPDYWGAPMISKVDNANSAGEKWGYYYDGKTNYVINVYTNDKSVREFQEKTGVEAIIREILNGERSRQTLGIAIFNPPIFLDQANQFNSHGVIWYSDNETLYNDYSYKSATDKTNIKQVNKSGNTISITDEFDNVPVLKTFIPVELTYPAIITVVSDLTEVQQTLNEQLIRLTLTISACSIAIIALVLGLITILNRRTEAAAQSVQNVYLENIDALFNSIKEQRHDFNNHVNTIQLLVKMKKYDDLSTYTAELVGESIAMNQIININLPALSALIQAKTTQAYDRRIKFEYDISNLKSVQFGTVKSTELVKIVSNLIDNAFDAVSETDKPDKMVKVTGRVRGEQLTFTVGNNGNPIPEKLKQQIFEAGFSTKPLNRKNSGLGLAIVQKILSKHRGIIRVESDEEWTEFSVRLPL
ncbi:ATP-binding protein [Paenibacillus sp. PsM32]|uniref:histidine kinase n=1 Tax=Paenibacillus kyungheensis TaxID=1452732 RepID=A0AAX3M3Q7_9BACL|nr:MULTISPECIES: ATP-binding protein [Paenibacillus]MDN4617300.1 ATP-binding protein [Paenibacillus sp. PsM32]MDQ1232854.1 signal transduction histidine kinase [Paenibacillus sp. SORGH_AS_0306]MDR6109902.1 signal transduction histidine kinase [Paenibacillus sp. SORGH_AS_0338]WCT56882.1 ATP-binding protein [Paenibacillus kyungheensis]WDF50026.1 ATP-binding protein [Paenibacillus sp. KACC 21273]